MKPLNNLAKCITLWRKRKGFHTPSGISTVHRRDLMLGKLMLVVSEVGEAAEAVRHNDRQNFEEEIADTFILLFDICGSCQIDIDRVLSDKMLLNEGRPFRHGKATTL